MQPSLLYTNQELKKFKKRPSDVERIDKNQIYFPGYFDTPTFGFAVFHQSTYNNLFTDGLSVTAGIRLDYEKAKLNPAAFPEFLARFNGRMKFIKGEKPAFCYRRQKNSRGEEADPLKLAESILDKMQDLLEERT